MLSPHVADVLGSSPGKVATRLGVMAVVTVAANIAVRWGLQQLYFRVRNPIFKVPRYGRHPRAAPSILLGMGVTGAVSVAFQAGYGYVLRSSLLVTSVSALRVSFGLPATAPYRETCGGSAFANAAMFVDLVLATTKMPFVPQLSVFGLNASPTTAAEQIALFGSGVEGERYYTPTRLVGFALQGVVAVWVSRHIRRVIRERLSPATRIPSSTMFPLGAVVAAIPAAVLQMLALVGDAESVHTPLLLHKEVPSHIAFTLLLAGNTLLIRRVFFSRVSKPSEEDVAVDRQVVNYMTRALCLQYSTLTHLPSLLSLWLRAQVDVGQDVLIIPILYALAASEVHLRAIPVDELCALCEGDPEPKPLVEFGTFEELWVPYHNQSVCFCRRGLQIGHLVRMPCCRILLHVNCVTALFAKPDGDVCPSCSTRVVCRPPDDAVRFIKQFESNEVSVVEKKDVLTETLIKAVPVLLNNHRFIDKIRERGPPPVHPPTLMITVEDIFSELINCPAPTATVLEIQTRLNDQLWVPNLALALVDLCAMCLCPLFEEPLFPAALSLAFKTAMLSRPRPTSASSRPLLNLATSPLQTFFALKEINVVN